MPPVQVNGNHPSQPSTTSPAKRMNGQFAPVSDRASNANVEQYSHGIQVIDANKEFNSRLSDYLSHEKVTSAGFNYHLISVFGSQSTGKSTLLNHIFGTEFGVMAETDRRQTTKGIWMSKNKKGGQVNGDDGGGRAGAAKMASNILVMDVEGTDGRERGEDQDFERKSALFALATSEVLIVNIWEHQVGLYQGANMGLLKTVFEVNLQLFLKDKNSTPRSLLFFVIRDHLGTTPLPNLRNTLIQDLTNIWSSLSKPAGLEKSKIHDYFDLAFVALPHKILQPERFVEEVAKLETRFQDGHRDSKRSAVPGEEHISGGVFLPEYHRRIPADGFPKYAESVWEQIESNKDLDLPTQQELLAQFRCDEISREVLVAFDELIGPLENRQAEGVRVGRAVLLPTLGPTMTAARSTVFQDFETEASRYHKGVYARKRAELGAKVDLRLKSLFHGQLSAAHKICLEAFSDAVLAAVKAGQKKGAVAASYDFATIVDQETTRAVERFTSEARNAGVAGTAWSDYAPELQLYRKDLDDVSARLRRDELRRLGTRVERWVRARLADAVGLEFNKLGSGRGGLGAPESGEKPAEKELWDRVWGVFVATAADAERRFAERAQSFDASPDEVARGRWRLRRKAWGALRAKIDEEVMEGNILLKLRENFEDKFRYDDGGVPRIWRPTDDIEGIYMRARESTVQLIPLLARFRLSSTSGPPPLVEFIGPAPSSASASAAGDNAGLTTTTAAAAAVADEDDLPPIGGVDRVDDDDDDDGADGSGRGGIKTLDDETTILSEAKRADLTARFKKTADGVYVEAKRSAIGGVAQIPLYFYGLLLALGWNEIVAVLRNPLYFLLLILLAIVAYVTFTLNLWGPMLRMANAASQQAVEVGKERLRDFLESAELSSSSSSGRTGAAGRRPIAMGGVGGDDGDDDDGLEPQLHERVPLQRLGADGRRPTRARRPGVDDGADADEI
ncbi:MAG: Dynamin-like GTPase that mediates homotypic ER fusion [Phylliscum demangeonii]|nr:MAG: Dynamin-like GTPase that mediates homotypic ER fusion [Phylliscum demangeonii]